jgi:hypothetical protein
MKSDTMASRCISGHHNFQHAIPDLEQLRTWSVEKQRRNFMSSEQPGFIPSPLLLQLEITDSHDLHQLDKETKGPTMVSIINALIKGPLFALARACQDNDNNLEPTKTDLCHIAETKTQNIVIVFINHHIIVAFP